MNNDSDAVLLYNRTLFRIYPKSLWTLILIQAGWQSGYAEACKALYSGSIPLSASFALNYLSKLDRRNAKPFNTFC